MKIEVLMSCYNKDNAQFLREAIKSTYEDQTEKPDSFRIVVDGPVNDEINNVLSFYEKHYPDVFIIQRLEKNGGLGRALRCGIRDSNYEYILRMDSDDISDRTRIEKQKKYAQSHPELDVIGTFTAEFIDRPDNLLSIRELKTSEEDIYTDAKKRTPVSHVSVLLKRDSVLKAGNYQSFLLYEDYYLWIRMIQNGARFGNFPEVLVFVRTDENRYRRKGSKQYIKSTRLFQHYLYGIGFVSYKEYLRNKYGRIIVAKVPVGIRKQIYEKKLRKQPNRNSIEGH